MKIGIDIDGVLTDIEKFQLDYGSKFYYEKYGKRIVDSSGYETYDIFNSDEKLDDKFWWKYFFYYETKIKSRTFSNEVIKKLKKEGYEVYIITARGAFLKKYNKFLYNLNKIIVKLWLRKNKIKYNKVIFSNEDKKDIIISNKIDIMIEDKVENIVNLSKIVPVICFDSEYNENIKGKNIIRCYSWYDIYSKIGTISTFK